MNTAQTKHRAKKSPGSTRKPNHTDLILRAQQVMNTTRKLVQKRCELEDRLRSWCPEDLIDFWKHD